MTKSDVGPIREFGMNIEKYAGEDAKQAVLEGSEIIGKASKGEVAGWLKNAMEKFDSLVDKKTRIEIMEICGINCAEKNKKHVERMLKKRQKFKTLEEFINAEMKNPSKIQRMEKEGNIIYQYYSPESFGKGLRCFCGLWRELPKDEKASKTWCHCSKGFVKKLWEDYAGKPVEVEVLESTITGAKECKFAIRI